MALQTAQTSKRYSLPEGRPDIRRWPVEAEGGQRIGTVRDFLVDEEDGRIRYLDVDLDDRDDRVLVPVGHARVDRERERVRLPGIGHEGLREVPTWSGRTEELDASRERRLGEAWDARYGENYHHRPDFYGSSPGDVGDRGARSGSLARLDELDDYEVADHDHDPRGWEVVDREGATLGRVDHLLGDTGVMKVQYFVVDLADAPGTGDHHVLVPAGHARLEPSERQVVLEGIGSDAFGTLPPYEGGQVDREHERNVGRAWSEALGEKGRYHHPRYRESFLWGRIDRTR